MPQPTLKALEKAAKTVYEVLPPTPQICWPLLSRRIGAEVWVKHENYTPLGAFKLRGALVYIRDLKRRQPATAGVIAASRGNHGQSVAFAAARFGFPAVVVVPHGNSPEKNAAMRALGADLVEHGRDFQDALEYAKRLANRRRLQIIPSFDEILVAGAASYSLELLRAVPGLDAMYVPIGLGSGICGAIAARDALGLKTEIVGVTAAVAPAYAESFAQGRQVECKVGPTVADGVACRVPDSRALKIILRGAARVVSVSEAEIRFAIRALFTDTHNAAEGAGAVALAALWHDRKRMRGRRVAVVLSGGNIDRSVFARVLSGGD